MPYSHPGKARVPRQARGVAAAGARVAGASTQRATRRTPWLGGSQGCGLQFPGRLGWLGAGRAPIGPSAAPPYLASVSLPGRGFQKGWGKAPSHGSLATTACQIFRTSSSTQSGVGRSLNRSSPQALYLSVSEDDRCPSRLSKKFETLCSKDFHLRINTSWIPKSLPFSQISAPAPLPGNFGCSHLQDRPRGRNTCC